MTNKTKLSWFTYITGHLLPTWLSTWSYNFKVWADLMTDNYAEYSSPWCESLERECCEWFWTSIGLDDTYSKDFLESLYLMVEDIDAGKVRTYSAEDVLKSLKGMVDEMED